MQINKKILGYFSCLADETRLKIVLAVKKGPKTVNEIHNIVNNISLSAISHQLAHLTAHDLLKFERNGREKLFQLSDDFCWCILEDAFNHQKSKCRCCELK